MKRNSCYLRRCKMPTVIMAYYCSTHSQTKKCFCEIKAGVVLSELFLDGGYDFSLIHEEAQTNLHQRYCYGYMDL